MSYIPSLDLQPELMTYSPESEYFIWHLNAYQNLMQTIQRIRDINELTTEQKDKIITYIETCLKWIGSNPICISDDLLQISKRIALNMYGRVNQWVRNQINEDDYTIFESYMDDIDTAHEELMEDIYLYRTLLDRQK